MSKTYEIYGKQFQMVDELMTGVQWDTCRPIAKKYEQAIAKNEGYFSITDMTSEDYCKLLAACLYTDEAWSKDQMKTNENWFNDNFPVKILQEIITDFFAQYPELSTNSALLFLAQKQLMKMILEKEVAAMDTTGLLNKLQSTPAE